ncbi:uncharacterized protein METZ01_LOCUS44815 [marine metagenome]|uniref:Phospholipid/glycerol acyltransferase domain-containing protein n=1 Tax=marine metagenome TaxID=408172 RepID=A0A381RKX0_9ZZZZ
MYKELPPTLKPRPQWVRYISAYIIFFLGVSIAKIRVQGRWNIPKKGPCVVACNHFGYLDPFFLVYAIQRPTSFLMQNDMGIEPYFLWAPMIYGAILTDRNRLAPSTIKQSIKTLENEEVLGIFPEGGMKGFELAPAKPGAVYLSAMRHVQVVPIGVHGGNQAWENIFRGVRSRIKINIGKSFGPLEITGSKNEKKTKIETISSELMCRIAALLPDDKHGVYSNDERIHNYRSENGFGAL